MASEKLGFVKPQSEIFYFDNRAIRKIDADVAKRSI